MLNKCKNLTIENKTIENKTQLNYLQLKTKQMKNFKFLATALAALAIFSCSKEKIDAPDETGTKSVTVTLEVSNPDTKHADKNQSAASTTIHDATVYFIDETTPNPKVVRQKELTAAEITALTGPGFTFLSIPAAAKKMFIVANYKANDNTLNYPVSATLNELYAAGVISAKVQNKKPTLNATSKASSDKVVMTGMSGVFKKKTGGGETEFDLAAPVRISPVVARIEIGGIKLTGVKNNVAVPADCYKLQGVYINNVYKEINLDGTVKGDVMLKTAAADFGNSEYPEAGDTGNNVYWADFYSSGILPSTAVGDKQGYVVPSKNGAAVIAADAQAWAYHIFPSNEMPHIILKFMNVKPDPAGIAPEPAFVTISKYKNATGETRPLTTFAKGVVYKIDKLDVDYVNSGPEPEKENISVTATVTIEPWSVHNIVPSL